jgi:hypothetical protein
MTAVGTTRKKTLNGAPALMKSMPTTPRVHVQRIDPMGGGRNLSIRYGRRGLLARQR